MSEYFIDGRWKHAMEDDSEAYMDYCWERYIESKLKEEDLK